MIQLYNPMNCNYSANGDCTLLPVEAVVKSALNGAWVLEMEHPIDEHDVWKYIEDNSVVKVPSFNGEQLFRILEKEKSDSGITVRAYPIFLDAKNDCFLKDVRPTIKNGQQALDIMCAANSKYRGKSDITRTSTSYFEYENLMEAINGDTSHSFISRWGGEVLYNNYEIIINERVGGDYGVELLYGKNIAEDGLVENIDMSEIVTRIYPKSFNGHKLSTFYVDSAIVDKYPIVHSKVMKFDDIKMREDCTEEDLENGVVVCDDQAAMDHALTQRCNEIFATGIDKPKLSIDADMILLQDTLEYADYKILETVGLGDTIHCKHTKLGIVTDARVVSLEYDCISERVVSVKLGHFEKTVFDRVDSVLDKVENVITPEGNIEADKVSGILDAMKTQLRYQKDIAKKQDVRAILFEDLDLASPTFGAMCLGTQGLQIANKRTADGRDWDWTTAANANGVVADVIMAGILADKTGKNSWNLDTGELKLEKFDLKVESIDEAIRKAELLIGENAENINASVQRIEKNSSSALESINGDVQKLTSKVDATMSPDQVKLEIQKEYLKGAQKVNTNTGYTFDDEGLTVSKNNSDLSTKITEDGMKVLKNNEVVLEANNSGVNAKNLHATTYLIIGDNSRFENYNGNRTGCFWIGGGK